MNKLKAIRSEWMAITGAWEKWIMRRMREKSGSTGLTGGCTSAFDSLDKRRTRLFKGLLRPAARGGAPSQPPHVSPPSYCESRYLVGVAKLQLLTTDSPPAPPTTTHPKGLLAHRR
ncbi:hypothetical protein E2C01_029552 [Portunus trituberculatus]|uniref:Uncharacterized protein n=1 Tax=Portunus trituberculatus TaxID=210409 RepID=A0A5B7EUW3_PORTR|nr:hypothetical protein [Portunus trituberculatus]